MTDSLGAIRASCYILSAPRTGIYKLSATKSGFSAVTLRITFQTGSDLVRDLTFTSVAGSATISVQASVNGTPSAGYYVGKVDPGVLGNTPVVDQLYTISVLPTEQLTNTQVKNLRDALKYLSLVQFTEQQGPEILRPATRGMQGSIAQNTRMDGMAMAITGGNPMEQYQELQVENGLGGQRCPHRTATTLSTSLQFAF